jgi:hypothetical protein
VAGLRQKQIAKSRGTGKSAFPFTRKPTLALAQVSSDMHKARLESLFISFYKPDSSGHPTNHRILFSQTVGTLAAHDIVILLESQKS